MRKEARAHQEHVRAEFERKVTAHHEKRGRKRLKQAGNLYRKFEGQAREALYYLIASVFDVVSRYARSKNAYQKLITDQYFVNSSRKRPNVEDRYSQIMCYVLQARSRPAREKAQRLGRIIQMLDEQGKRGPAVIGAILDLGGVSKAHEAAKLYFATSRLAVDQAEGVDVAQRSRHQPEQMKGAERQEDEESEAEESDLDTQGGRADCHPAYSRARKSSPKRNCRYLEVTATEKQKARVLRLERDPERVKLTCRVEGDPAAKDGWRIITVEEVEVLD